MKKIVFTGGGTLGHVMPNIYLMEELKDYEQVYIGGNGIEKEKLNGKIKYFEIPTTKLVRGKLFCNFSIPFKMLRSIKIAKEILMKEKPNVVFSKGGYVALPVCLAARKLKIPIIAHESDYSFGLANKIILKLCNTMCVNFKNLANIPKIKYTGPIFSKEFDDVNKNTNGLNLDRNKPTMLIVGGSLGSKIINDVVNKNLDKILNVCNVIHITGKGNLIKKSYKNYNAFELRNDMSNLYNVCDFVLGRSGAGVTAECFYKRKPMILVPLENKSSRGDQVQNAMYYKNFGIAKIIRENELNEKSLLNSIQNSIKNLDEYKKKYKKISQKNGKETKIKTIKKY